MRRYFYLTFFICFATLQAFASETCSRVAIINYQEVLVDTSSNGKGEGLRYYLQKDATAESLLNEYQEKNKPSIWSAAASTTGSIMILGGILQTNDAKSGITNRNTLIYGGLLLTTISYLFSKTLKFGHEQILKRSVDQYNKRNLPRIYFSPFKDNNSVGAGIGVQQEF